MHHCKVLKVCNLQVTQDSQQMQPNLSQHAAPTPGYLTQQVCFCHALDTSTSRCLASNFGHAVGTTSSCDGVMQLAAKTHVSPSARQEFTEPEVRLDLTLHVVICHASTTFQLRMCDAADEPVVFQPGGTSFRECRPLVACKTNTKYL